MSLSVLIGCNYQVAGAVIEGGTYHLGLGHTLNARVLLR
jgi:hypothetical protein